MFAATVLTAAPGLAQQTIVIGGDKPGTKSGDAVQRETPGVVVNDDVLNSLGAPGTFAPALPPTSPYGASVGQEPLVAPGTSGTAYRLPDTGQLVVSRPSTLLFPPQIFPQSHLTVPPPAGSVARTTLAPEFSPAQSGTGQSRLLVPKPVEPMVAQPAPSAPLAPAVPRVPVTPAPTASAAPAESPPVAEPAPMAAAKPMEEPAPPPVATIAPTREPMVPATPPAMAALPPEPAPAAEPPAPSSMVKDLQSATPPAVSSPAPEPAPSAPAAQQTPTPAPAPAPSQSAALPPVGAPIGDIRVVFDEESAELTAAAKGLLEGVAKELLNNAEARVQLLAYAKGGEDGTSRARRLSLSRALAVRAYLIEKGVRSTRMDVRALGSGFKDGPPDRVDVLPQESTQ